MPCDAEAEAARGQEDEVPAHAVDGGQKHGAAAGVECTLRQSTSAHQPALTNYKSSQGRIQEYTNYIQYVNCFTFHAEPFWYEDWGYLSVAPEIAVEVQN